MKDDAFNILYQLADTVIYLEEIDEKKIYRKMVFDASKAYTRSFFEQVNKKLKSCNTEEDKNFVKESAFNFLVASLKKIVVDFDCPDENIEMIANHVRDQLIAATRKEYQKSKSNK